MGNPRQLFLRIRDLENESWLGLQGDSKLMNMILIRSDDFWRGFCVGNFRICRVGNGIESPNRQFCSEVFAARFNVSEAGLWKNMTSAGSTKKLLTGCKYRDGTSFLKIMKSWTQNFVLNHQTSSVTENEASKQLQLFGCVRLSFICRNVYCLGETMDLR